MIFLDNAATTPLHPKALEAMLPYMKESFANPSSVYGPARQVRKAIDDARQTIAAALGANAAEIFFTAGGTESDNWAIKGALTAPKAKGKHVITSAVEHPGVFNFCEFLQKQGYEVTFVPVDTEGIVNPKDIEAAIRPDTCLISVMLANNEVGAIQPITQIGAIAKARGVLLHTDAVQAVGHMPVNVDALGADLLTLSAHKFYGPKGIGALYVRKGTPFAPLFHGGAQERGRRPGTENVVGIIGMAAALSASLEEMDAEQKRLTLLRDRLISGIHDTIPHTKLNGPLGEKRLAGNVNVSFRFIEGESLLLHLDMLGFYASTGSACSSGALEPSHVLMAMGLSHELANGAIRFSLGRENTAEDIEKLLTVLQTTVQKLRDLSPLYDDFMAGK